MRVRQIGFQPVIQHSNCYEVSLNMSRHAIAIAMLLAGSSLPADEPTATSDDGAAKGVIAFASLADRGWDAYTIQMDGEPSRITKHPANDYNLAFSADGSKLAFVSERDGNVELYSSDVDGSNVQRLTDDVAMDDHPSWSPDGTQIAFSSTRQANEPGRSWNGIYVMNSDGGAVKRISPQGASDYSPAWSPTGDWIAFASGTGLPASTDVYVMRPDGSDRRLVVRRGGWPAWIDGGTTLAFHREVERDSWSILRINVDGSNETKLLDNASMPRSTPDGTKIAFVARDGGGQQIGIFDVKRGDRKTITDERTSHWNPAVSPDGTAVAYHRSTANEPTANVEHWNGPAGSDLGLLRIDGAFPAFSPDYSRVAFAARSFATIDVMNVDGAERTTIFEGTHRSLFGVSWSHEPERIAFSHGTLFGKADVTVNIKATTPTGDDLQELTGDDGNNGFPIYSPDGKQIVFRSGRDGQKNLYIMNRDGSDVRRLTNGDWTDTMCDWSHDGQWITFASDRDNNFEVWLVRTDGSDLKKLIGGGGRNNHPHFSPDDQWIVFTSQRAGYSAETISMPRQPQAYGDLFIIRTDGSGLTRLTHNSNEDGTPAWGKSVK